MAKGFCHDIHPVEVSVNFDDLYEAVLDLVFEVMPFKGNVFGTNL
jgi:hypothetical protein